MSLNEVPSALQVMIARSLMFLLLLVCSSSLAHAQHHYKVTNLGILPGETVTTGYGLNDHGDVVGSCGTYTATNNYTLVNEHPFLYQSGKITDFAANGLYNYVTGRATGINNRGLICGYFYGPRKVPKTFIPYVYLAFVYNGNFKPITDGHHSSWAVAINNSGEMTGYYTPLDETLSTTNYLNDTYHPYTFINDPAAWGMFKDIYLVYHGTYSVYMGMYDDSQPNAINDHGQVVGTTLIFPEGEDNFFPISWLDSTGAVQFLSAPILWYGLGINYYGQIVGVTGGQFQRSAFPIDEAVIYQKGVLKLLPALSQRLYPQGIANGINDAGEIVGRQYVQQTGQGVAAVWLNNNVYNLNVLGVAPGVALTDAVAVNQGGQILCNGKLNGAKRAFLLSPQ
jgi:uncharacterized membrane protein